VPLYEYECPKCGLFELIRKFSDEPVTVCPTCGSEIQKLASAPAFHLKGSGWYVTDYAKKGSGESGSKSGKAKAEEAKSGASDSAGGKTDGKSSESKSSESKSESKPAKESKESSSKPAASSSSKKSG
jgi:putative FmdB family regulatory protein